MFSGIVTEIGHLRHIDRAAGEDGGARIFVECRLATEQALGASIACNGICLTVIRQEESGFFADLSPETLRCTTACDWRVGQGINLEAAIRMGEAIGGHLVTGHVDHVITVKDLCHRQDHMEVTLVLARHWGRFVAAKGSVALDGVALTVNTVVDGDAAMTCFSVNIIPHTAAVTTLGGWQCGGRVNFEIDLIARYLDRLSSA